MREISAELAYSGKKGPNILNLLTAMADKAVIRIELWAAVLCDCIMETICMEEAEVSVCSSGIPVQSTRVDGRALSRERVCDVIE